ncbi:MAG TPA: HD domain-containing protein [Terracidiphilus sp.]|nr:HD domain-containing protein [Terracidiphilus sp.]
MQQIVDFILELDKLKGVTRKTRPLGLDRYENSAEHSWQLAMLAAAAAQFAAEPVDVDRVIRMLLVHDIGEIDTGDTMVYVQGGWEERHQAELAAVTRIFGLLPDGQGDALLALWSEFNEGKTAESKFAQAVDRAMPVLLNLANNGQSWRENGIAYERVVTRIEGQIRTGCPALWEYVEARLKQARDSGWFGFTQV